MKIGSVVHGLLAAAALAFPLSRSAQAMTNCGAPGPNQAIVWQHDNFTGNCDILLIGNYSAVYVSRDLSVGNNNISAVSVGSNVKVTLYDNDLPGLSPGDWMPVITTRSVAADFNDKTSAIAVASRTGCTTYPAQDQCVVWADANYSGNCDVLDLASSPVPYPKLANLSVGNDTISSAICGSGTTLTFWEHENNGGVSFFVNAAALVSFVGLSFNDIASSIVLQATCTVGGGGCGTNEYCKRQTDGCTATTGLCTTEPTSCDATIVPVCGCDGRSYANDCEREASGVSKLRDGVCSVAACPGTIPSQGTACSPSGMQCVYSVNGTSTIQPASCTNGLWSLAAVIRDP